MGVLSQVWGVTTDANQRTDLATVARQLDTLARGMGFARPDTIPAPGSLTATDPASRIEAWESWYNGGPASGATPSCPPTTVLQTRTDTSPAGWSALVALAAGRNVPGAVNAYLTVQGATWESILPHWTTPPEASAVIQNAQRSLQAWWFTRLGGASGTPAAWASSSSGGGADTGQGFLSGDGTKLLLALGLGALLLRRRSR